MSRSPVDLAAAGETGEAARLAAERVAGARADGLPTALGAALVEAAHTSVVLGDPTAAAVALSEALTAPEALGDGTMATLLGLSAVVAAHRERYGEAGRLLGAVDRLRAALGDAAPPPPYGAGFARQRVKAAVGQDALAAGLTEGAGLAGWEAAALAASVVGTTFIDPH